MKRKGSWLTGDKCPGAPEVPPGWTSPLCRVMGQGERPPAVLGSESRVLPNKGSIPTCPCGAEICEQRPQSLLRPLESGFFVQ